MHYGSNHEVWDSSLDAALADGGEVRAAIRSESAFDTMASALLRALDDPYSAYASPQDMSRPPASSLFGLQLVAGRFADDAPDVGGVAVWGVMPDSPAEAAGLQMGDRVLQIDTIDDPASLTTEQLGDALRGADDAAVGLRLRVVRHGREASEWVTLPQPAQQPAAVHSRKLPGGVGYLRITSFSEAGSAQLASEIQGLRTAGCSRWVFDLRNNPGGQLTEARTPPPPSVLLPSSPNANRLPVVALYPSSRIPCFDAAHPNSSTAAVFPLLGARFGLNAACGSRGRDACLHCRRCRIPRHPHCWHCPTWPERRKRRDHRDQGRDYRHCRVPNW